MAALDDLQTRNVLELIILESLTFDNIIDFLPCRVAQFVGKGLLDSTDDCLFRWHHFVSPKALKNPGDAF